MARQKSPYEIAVEAALALQDSIDAYKNTSGAIDSAKKKKIAENTKAFSAAITALSGIDSAEAVRLATETEKYAKDHNKKGLLGAATVSTEDFAELHRATERAKNAELVASEAVEREADEKGVAAEEAATKYIEASIKAMRIKAIKERKKITPISEEEKEALHKELAAELLKNPNMTENEKRRVTNRVHGDFHIAQAGEGLSPQENTAAKTKATKQVEAVRKKIEEEIQKDKKEAQIAAKRNRDLRSASTDAVQEVKTLTAGFTKASTTHGQFVQDMQGERGRVDAALSQTDQSKEGRELFQKALTQARGELFVKSGKSAEELSQKDLDKLNKQAEELARKNLKAIQGHCSENRTEWFSTKTSFENLTRAHTALQSASTTLEAATDKMNALTEQLIKAETAKKRAEQALGLKGKNLDAAEFKAKYWDKDTDRLEDIEVIRAIEANIKSTKEEINKTKQDFNKAKSDYTEKKKDYDKRFGKEVASRKANVTDKLAGLEKEQTHAQKQKIAELDERERDLREERESKKQLRAALRKDLTSMLGKRTELSSGAPAAQTTPSTKGKGGPETGVELP